MRIAVAGGTGVVGRHVAAAVRAAGATPVVLARSVGVDVATGTGLDRALDGVDALVDTTNVTTMSRSASIAFFDATTRTLLAAGQRAGVRHHVALSIVGVDRVHLGYYAGKVRQEELVLDGAVPATVLRATQFHEFAGQLLQRIGRSPLVVVPTMLSRPVAAREVGDELVRLALGGPTGMAPELAGPEEHRMPDLVRRLLRRQGSHRPVVPLRLPGAVGHGMATGGLLPTGAGVHGRQTFDEWLAGPDRVAASSWSFLPS